MANRYFESFPTIYYANNYVVNITERVGILNSVLNNPYLYLPFINEQNERPDNLSERYYEDQYMSWMIYLANKTIDPYYGWYLDEEQFNESVAKKYNLDTYTLQKKVAFYRNNWYGDTGNISTADFDALPIDLQKYWEPVYTSGSYIPIGYSRKQNDWQTNTNSIRTYTPSTFNYTSPTNGPGQTDVYNNYLTVGIPNPSWVTTITANLSLCTITFSNGYVVSPATITGPAGGTNVYTFTGTWAANTTGFPITLSSTYGVNVSTFVKDEIVDIVFNTNNKGTGQVAFANSSSVTLQHISGVNIPNNTVTITGSSYLYGTESSTNSVFSDVIVVADNIPPSENTYWTPVTIYEYEREQNEPNRQVNILSSQYASQAATEIKKLLASNG